jgi:hypothetical protein
LDWIFLQNKLDEFSIAKLSDNINASDLRHLSILNCGISEYQMNVFAGKLFALNNKIASFDISGNPTSAQYISNVIKKMERNPSLPLSSTFHVHSLFPLKLLKS